MSRVDDSFTACKMRHYVTIEQATETNTYGDITRTWSTYKKRWASIRPLTGRERWAAMRAEADVSHCITIRYTEGVTPKMRITHGSRIFEIGAVTNVNERGRVMYLLCTEQV